LKHTASARFWQCLDALHQDVQTLARRSFARLKADPMHSSLHFKALANGRFHGVHIGRFYRSPGLRVEGCVHWFRIGTHAYYDEIIG
jgi:hypothetical protein